MQRDLEFLIESNEHMRAAMLGMGKQWRRMGAATQRLIKGNDPKDLSSVNDLGHWDSRDGCNESAPLTTALQSTSQAMTAVGEEWNTHVRRFSPAWPPLPV